MRVILSVKTNERTVDVKVGCVKKLVHVRLRWTPDNETYQITALRWKESVAPTVKPSEQDYQHRFVANIRRTPDASVRNEQLGASPNEKHQTVANIRRTREVPSQRVGITDQVLNESALLYISVMSARS